MTEYQIALQLFPGYRDSDTRIIREFANSRAQPKPGFLTDFLGCRIRTTSVWKQARTLDGQLLEIPVPGDFHAEAIEWIGLLKAVRGAKEKYVAMELGAGFGPWTIAGAVAARRRGIQNIRLCAVEGDAQHYRSLRQHFVDNGFDPDAHRLLEAAVGVQVGVAHWPVIDESAATEEWGIRPMDSDTDYTGRQFQQTRQINVVSMRDLVVTEDQWDLIHIDVQGHEVDICRSCIDELNKRARWIVVGTHSRKLDGDFLQLMWGSGWFLEHEKPTKFNYAANQCKLEAMTILDGTQVWRNPRLATAQQINHLSSFSQAITSLINHIDVKAEEKFTLPITVTNTGTEAWFGSEYDDAPVNASYRWLDENGRPLSIEGCRTSLQAPLWPGDHSRFNLEVIAPPKAGSYVLQLSMVQEGVAWFIDKGANSLILRAIVS